VLSFDALRSLAITLGLPDSIAWLWPCAIDVAIAQATLCLLSLSRHGGDVMPARGQSGSSQARHRGLPRSKGTADHSPWRHRRDNKTYGTADSEWAPCRARYYRAEGRCGGGAVDVNRGIHCTGRDHLEGSRTGCHHPGPA
jgi:hypothetical protein